MNTESILGRRFSATRRAAVMVVVIAALAGVCLAFGGEIHNAAGAGDLAKVQALLKGNPGLVSSRDETRRHTLALCGGV